MTFSDYYQTCWTFWFASWVMSTEWSWMTRSIMDPNWTFEENKRQVILLTSHINKVFLSTELSITQCSIFFHTILCKKYQIRRFRNAQTSPLVLITTTPWLNSKKSNFLNILMFDAFMYLHFDFFKMIYDFIAAKWLANWGKFFLIK